MSIDTFFGLDDADGSISPEQVREYKARMARNKRQMAAAKKQEGKQKKKEDKLVAIILKFIRNSARKDITLLISRCLEQNIPAVFILAVILLGNREIQAEVGIHLQLEDGEIDLKEKPESNGDEKETSLADLEQKEFKGALVTLGADHSLPLKMRMGIDLWTRSIWNAMEPTPERIFKTVIEFNENPKAKSEPKPVVGQLAAFILRDYFKDNHFEQEYENIKTFAEFLIKGLLVRLKEQAKNQKQLEKEEN
ncbi:hypothetical protein HN748_05755 [Candidatus Peregrinibacteria bacterium]|mgnify:CR=1 FL=1|jgi:hypothetical protein|nr:hypothetical protein [Candidatus Peregrinibacteria bacterium]MBT7484686.1 hypothetical protein [Candidatus Peregrinibacteria bacterium]MBT7703713.1 hypothetical protein [Candidatus Peregrinibacteria bacterium]